MPRVKKSDIDSALSRLGEAVKMPTSREQAIELGYYSYLAIDHASCYGGYRLVSVSVDGGGHSGALGGSSVCPRKNAADFLSELHARIDLIRYLDQKGGIGVFRKDWVL